MKAIAILSYEFMFDPSETWTNGYLFENQLADFFAAYGFECQIIASTGGTGKRVIFVQRVAPSPLTENIKTTSANPQIKQIQNKVPPKDFKKFKDVRHNPVQPPKLNYQPQANSNRGKVRMP